MTDEKSRSASAEDDEFFLMYAKLTVFAPISLSDDEGEKLTAEIEAELELSLEAIRTSLHEKFPNIRIAYEV